MRPLRGGVSGGSEKGDTEARDAVCVCVAVQAAMKERRRCLQFSGSDSAPHPASVLDAASSAWSHPAAPSPSATSMSAEEQEEQAAPVETEATQHTSSASSSSLGDVC